MLNLSVLKRASALGLSLALVFGVTVVSRGQATAPSTAAKAKAKGKTKAKALLDLNTATEAELQETLPGVGPVTAKKIVAARPFTKVEDLSKVGVSEKHIEEIKKLVTLGKPAAAATTASKPAAATKSATSTKSLVDINKADVAELETLPGIGPATAKAIVAGRPYKSIDDLDRIKGLGKTKIEALRSHVTAAAPVAETPAETPVATKTAAKKAAGATKSSSAKPALTKPVNINTASKDELDALPGIGPVKAQAIIDTRPFKTIEDVMKVKGIKEGEFSKIKDLITVK